ncbi:type 4 pilus major pilin [Stenotrophomonas mori]|uniref:Prepilin-type N-terminal cleavage/methylation domain-containing protein n=1 Tax=Stenotrophomonas mori TaxID=2871096 RepID=A0ABT0SD26_9GAMM|nr:type 4 pilus major pilin [Stenotrophomonas mori]MCL7713221.1 prepilin-type N-terminal cleavage/methylation domain-containing protein [Stenotrophomonas mori]
MKNFKQARSQGGFSLIELLLVLAIIAALAVAAFIVYPRVQAGRNASYEAQVLSSAQAGVKALFTTNNYAKLSKAAAFNAEIFPANMNLSETSIKNQWDGEVEVGPSTAKGAAATATGNTPVRYFRFVYRNVPADVCIRLAGAAVQNFGTVLIDKANGGAGEIVQDLYSPANVPLNEAEIAKNCKAAAQVGASITFVSN